MNLTTEQMEQIVDGAPDGAEYFVIDKADERAKYYLKMNIGLVNFWDNGWRELTFTSLGQLVGEFEKQGFGRAVNMVVIKLSDIRVKLLMSLTNELVLSRCVNTLLIILMSYSKRWQAMSNQTEVLTWLEKCKLKVGYSGMPRNAQRAFELGFDEGQAPLLAEIEFKNKIIEQHVRKLAACHEQRKAANAEVDQLKNELLAQDKRMMRTFALVQQWRDEAVSPRLGFEPDITGTLESCADELEEALGGGV